MTNCAIPTPPEQKILLKLETCLFNNFILNRTSATDNYLALPSSDNYAAMLAELDATIASINSYITVNYSDFYNETDCSGNALVASIWVADAQGVPAYNSADVSGNLFANAVDNSINVNGTISNVGVLKTVQKLNMDDCAEKAYQVVPVSGLIESVTQASLVKRVGCPGTSNVGFIALVLQAPIECAPFNTCSTKLC
jgi:hypothetical protein